MICFWRRKKEADTSNTNFGLTTWSSESPPREAAESLTLRRGTDTGKTQPRRAQIPSFCCEEIPYVSPGTFLDDMKSLH